MANTIFIAIRKENGSVMVGQKGQAAFTDVGSLRKSIAYSYQYEAKQKGVKAAELYSIHEVEVSTLLPRKDTPPTAIEKLDKVLYHYDTEDMSDPYVRNQIQSELIDIYNELKGE